MPVHQCRARAPETKAPMVKGRDSLMLKKYPDTAALNASAPVLAVALSP